MYDYSNYGHSSYDLVTTILSTVFGAYVGFMFTIIFAFFVGLYAVLIVSKWKLFKKAGKNGWEAIIPFYSSYVMFEICGYPGWYAFLGVISFVIDTICAFKTFDSYPALSVFLRFIPFVVNIILFVLQIMAYISLAKKFGKSSAYGVCVVFFPFVCIPMLALGSATYDESLGDHKNSRSTNNANNTANENVKYCPNCGEKLVASDKVCSKCNIEV